MEWVGAPMNRKRWALVGAFVMFAAVSWILSSLFLRVEDSCLSAELLPTQIHPRNPYLYSCAGKIYLPVADLRVRFKRVDAMRANEVEVLPFRYVRSANQLHYVATLSVGWEETEHALRVIDGIDLSTVEILEEHRIRDKNNVYTVMNDHVIVEPRS